MAKINKCKACGEVFEPQRLGQKVCSMQCAIQISKELENKKELQEKKKEVKEWKVKKKKLIEENKSLSDYQKELQKEINTIVRLLDRGHNCISSDMPLNKGINAGHLFSVGSNPTLRYNLHNIWNQSVHDNLYKSGNFEGYQKGLIRLFGHSYFEYVESLKSLPPLRLTKQEIIEKKAICKEIIKELREMNFLDNSERLEMRYKLNKRIGIYEL
jgi:hypothetical protein